MFLKRNGDWMKRVFPISRRLGPVRLVLLLLLAGSIGCDAMVGRMITRGATQNVSSSAREMMLADDLSVFLCGTGSPLPDASAASACTLVSAGGRLYVVDVGVGSQEVAQLAGVPTERLAGVFLTHFHSDHIGELGEWAMQSWVAGRNEPLAIYGAEGIEDVVEGFKRAYRLDDAYRIAHHGLAILPQEATEWIPTEVPYAKGPAAPVLEREGLVVSAFAVDHEPVSPAVGYRFDYKGRSVVISGDTDRSDNLVVNARGADVLIHEVLLKDVIGQTSEALRESGQTRRATLAKDVLDYHTSPSEAVEAADAAGVDTVVFTHLVPAVPGRIRNWLFKRDLPRSDVRVVVGEDGLRIRLPAGGDRVEIDR